MKKLFLFVFSVLLFAACSGNADIQETAGAYDNMQLTTHASTEFVSTSEAVPSPASEPYREWTIEELGEIIVAGGTFWYEWWYFGGRFNREHIDWEESLFGQMLLLPASGFENIDDIRYYLLQYYTENWIDRELGNQWGAPFSEYNNMLLISTGRWRNVHPNWEKATHTLIEQYDSHAVVDTTVLIAAWYWPGVDPMEHAWEATIRFIFVDGRIDSPGSDDMFRLIERVPAPRERTEEGPLELREAGVAPLIPNITVLSPKAFVDDLLPSATDLIITFTDVYDFTNVYGACGMTSRNFFLAPTGTISFNRDVEFIRYGMDDFIVAAGEVISMHEHSRLYFVCKPYELLTFPYTFERGFTFVAVDNPSEAPLLYESNRASYCGCYGSCRLSNHAISEPREQATWQEAYASLLKSYIAVWGDVSGNFILFDIDGNGIPELIVRDRKHFTTYFSAYTFADGIVIPLESEYFYDYATNFFPVMGNISGLGMSSNEGVWDSVALLVINEYRLVPEVSLRRGKDENGIWWRLNGADITEEEHTDILNNLFGALGERQNFWGQTLNEAAIYSELLSLNAHYLY